MAYKNEPSFQGTVLIIDDSSSNCELCRIYLELEGFQVHIAANGQEGINAVRQIRPDVVLLDIMMPGMDGFQMLEQFKADPSVRDIPVLIHSVRNETQAVVKALQMGADDFLKKPFDVDELIARVKRLVIFKQARDALVSASTALTSYQQVIDVALQNWEREVEALKKQYETGVINIPAGTDAAFKLEQAMTSSDQARNLINRIVKLSRCDLPEYNALKG